jgi:radical SAM superfamily enzyme YgiQ (UPF0313 family)
MATTHEPAKRLIRHIRELRRDAYVIVGGPNPTALPRETLEELEVDLVITGEGEDALVASVQGWFAGTRPHGVIAGTGRDDIDSYPFPARDLADPTSYGRKLQGEPVISIISSRGCRGRCAFCNSTIMGSGSKGQRFRSVANVIAELSDLRSKWRFFRFNDDTFTGRRDLLELLATIEELDIVFRIFARVEDLTPQVAEALTRAGCVHVSVGLESLDPANLRVLRKAKQIGRHQNVRFARDAGLTVRAFFMVGLPADTDRSIEHYFAEAATLGIDEFSLYPLIPYPGSAIARDPAQWGYQIIEPDWRRYVQIGVNGSSTFALRHQNFEPEDVVRWRKRAEQILRSSGARHSRESAVAG